MNLRQLRYFTQTVDTGNITRAADQLHVAQPALGLQIRHLEEELGLPLLIRHSRGVSPTDAGKLLYERAQEILRLVEATRQDIISGTANKTESITLGLTPGLGKLFGADLMLRVRDDMANVSLAVVEEMSFVLIDAIERGEIHLALAYEVAERPGLARDALFDEELLFVTANTETAETISFEEVLDHPLVLAGGRDHVHQLVHAAAERVGRTPDIAFEASSVSIMKSLVLEGAVSSIMPYGSVIGELKRGELVFRRISGGALVRTLYLVHSLKRPPLVNETELAELIKLQIRGALSRVEPMVTRREGLVAAEEID